MPASRLIIQEMVLKWHQHLMSMSFYLSMNGNNYTEIVKHALFIENKRKPVTGNYEVKSEFITTGPASEDQTKPSDQEYALHGEDQDCNVWYLNPSETKNEVLRPQPSFPSPNQQCWRTVKIQTYNVCGNHMARKHKKCGSGRACELTVNVGHCKRLKLHVRVDVEDTDTLVCEHQCRWTACWQRPITVQSAVNTNHGQHTATRW